MPNFPPTPSEVKHIAHFLKIADEHDERNIVVSYWSRMYACQVAMKTVTGKKPPEVTALLVAIMDWLEQIKKAHHDNEGLTNETCAQALIEEYALQLFQYADGQDQAENFGKNVVKAFYTAGILMDVLQQFGKLSEDMYNKRKYAKWKAAYIHNCLKNGEKPFSGPPVERNLLGDSDDDDDDEVLPRNVSVGPKPGVDPPVNSVQPSQPSLPSDPQSPTVDQPNTPVTPEIPPTIPAPSIFPQPVPSSDNNSVTPTPIPTPSNVSIGPEQIEKAQKYCKWAGSALNYDDVTNAVDNLQKALHLLQFGVEK